MKKKITVLTAFLALIAISSTLLAKDVSACSCTLQSDSVVAVGCDDDEIGKCTWPEGTKNSQKDARKNLNLMICSCEAEIPGENCAHEGETPTVSKPCCSGLKAHNYGYGSTCIDENIDPYQYQEGEDQTEDGTSLKCDGGTGINTAIGCIHIFNSENAFLSDLLRWATGIGGGIAFALMLYAGFMIMTASGNPERIKAGQELLTSAIAGLILLVLSIVILKFIGVDILGLDKFGFNQ